MNEQKNRQNKADILLIDDTLESLQLLVNLLSHHGYKIRPTSNTKLALSTAQKYPPDLILLDIVMPEMNGYQVCEQLKSSPVTREIPVIFISAIDEVLDKVKAFSIGGVDYITKPFQVTEVLLRIETHLKMRKLQKTLQEKNEQLARTLQELKTTQTKLVEAAKMAALGELVAGVAHEINTPIGISVTAASTLAEDTQIIVNSYQTGKLKRSELECFLDTASDSSRIILANLSRADNLITSFKQVAVDRSSDLQRCFKVKKYLEEIVYYLGGKSEKSQHQVIINGDENIAIYSYPGGFAQIITNLMINSFVHGFDERKTGEITINFQLEGEEMILEYMDNGRGINSDNLKKIFEPFFTTKRNQGNTGLGLHIVYNLVNQQFKGTIKCESKEGVGTKFIIRFPISKDLSIPI
ncbi:hybrid sensor histidine kinase/response regulator [Oscillatoria salina]|uniref:hybrid sensor histidine kinase/response regulator n=1 Tax=Oscillatoria salina TaxID=331517 RepID=UPI001CCAE7BE|nr:hybrid sensor histidine kinase/response regulator [Oscillatoria salina]MBZ8180184.1 response regulator [Oscillatoria salina IIICB1]